MSELPHAEQELLVGAERRLGSITLVLVGAGTGVVAWRWGGLTAAAFAFGGVLAYLNYRWIVAVVDTLVRAQRARPTRGTYGKIFLPLALLAAVLYVIFSRRWLAAAGVMSGVLVLAAAVLVELVYEVILELRH